MKLEVGKKYFTVNGNVAEILFIMPDGINDKHPCVGYIQDGNGYRIGASWNHGGESFDHADSIADAYVDLEAIGKYVYQNREFLWRNLLNEAKTKEERDKGRIIALRLGTLLGQP